MISYIWGFMMLSSIVLSIINGSTEVTMNAAFEGANEAVGNMIGFLGAMCMWTGLIKIAEESGVISVFSKMISPVTKALFPSLKKGEGAQSAISMNIVANLLGLGNAATPLGIRAMEKLNERNIDKTSATNEMCMLVVLNTASIQIIPSTLIAIRSSMGSLNASEVIVPIWVSSIITAIIAMLVTGLCGLRRKGN